jgi:peptide deformylase
MILKIVQAGDPVLRKPSRPLSRDEILSPTIQELIERMHDTMRDAPGVGLAAPQVGIPFQLCVIEDPPEYSQGLPPETAAAQERHGVPFHVLCNPRLYIEEPAEVTFFEGCLSLHGFSALVPRAVAVKVEALDHRAEPVSIRARGWYARILQHEIDHLNGWMYIDRMESRSLTTAENHSRHWRGKSVAEVQTILRIDTHRR